MQYRNRRYASHVRAARIQKQILFGVAGVLLVLALIFGLRAIFYRPPQDSTSDAASKTATDQVSQSEQANVAKTDEQVMSDEEDDPLDLAEGAKPETTAKASTTSDGKVKMLPVIYRKKNEEKKIAITIDDCLQPDNMREIMKLAEKHKIGLTFFPKGDNIKKNADLWREVYEKGFEIENHSYAHVNVSKLKTADQLRAAIVNSEKALNEALGVNYQMRCFRCPTGDGMNSEKLHKMLRELGYEAVASWGLSGTRKAEDTIKMAQGGQIILFHSTDSDLARLKKVIPGLINKGFELVTVNDLYDKGPNKVTELTLNTESTGEAAT